MDSVSPGSTRDFASAASAAIVEKTREALSERGITVTVVDTRGEALERLKALIPPGASVNTGASVSLREIGFEELLTSGSHPWRNLKGEYLAEKDAAKQRALRRQGLAASTPSRRPESSLLPAPPAVRSRPTRTQARM